MTTTTITVDCVHLIDAEGACSRCGIVSTNAVAAPMPCLGDLYEGPHLAVRCWGHLALEDASDFVPVDADEVAFRFDVTGNPLVCDRAASL